MTRPVSSAEKRRRGTYRRDRDPAKGADLAVLPAVPWGPPDVPADLDGDGRAAWARVWMAGQAWLNPALDWALIEQVCRLSDEIAGHRADLARFGRMLTEPILNRHGTEIGRRLVPNPALRSLRGAEDSRRRDLSELGFTPAARAALGFTTIRTQSKLEEMMERRTGLRPPPPLDPDEGA